MAKEIIETGKAPLIHVECQGNLKVKGWTDPTVLAKGDSFTFDNEEKGVFLKSSGDLYLMVPMASSLNIQVVNGDFSVKSLAGDSIVHQIMGDASFRNAGEITIDTVNGDLSVRNGTGSLTAQEVLGDLMARNVTGVSASSIYGDFSARSIFGPVSITSTMGDTILRSISGDVNLSNSQRDVNLRSIGGQVSITRAEGDIRLRGNLVEGKHTFSAGGDIVVRWPIVEPLHVDASAPRIKNSLPLDDLKEEEGILIGRLGEGEVFLNLQSDRAIILRPEDAYDDAWPEDPTMQFDIELELENFGDKISAEINQRIFDWSKQMEEQFGENLAAQIERSAEKAAARAEKVAERAMRKAEKAAQKASWRTSHSSWVKPIASLHSSPKERRVSEEEQLKILQMVEKGVISPEEATTLLEAIEN